MTRLWREGGRHHVGLRAIRTGGGLNHQHRIADEFRTIDSRPSGCIMWLILKYEDWHILITATQMGRRKLASWVACPWNRAVAPGVFRRDGW